MAFCAFLLLGAAPCAAAAQVVTGTVVEEETGAPVPGAVLELVDEAGRVSGSGISGAAGAFRLQAPGPGLFRVRTSRLGYYTTTVAVNLGAGAEERLRIAIAQEAITLQDMRVSARSRCDVRPGSGLSTHTLWEAARKALTAASVARRQLGLEGEVHRYERDLDPDGRTLRERRWSRVGPIDRPFVSAPADELARQGYVRFASDGGAAVFAPDADVLLSDAFLETHCFRATPGEDSTLVGLAFEPIRGRRATEVAGVLWLDRRSSELKYLEFRFTGTPRPWVAAGVGGRVDFDLLPTGVWIVRRWSIRVPVVSRERIPTGPGLEQTRDLVTGFREEGGEVASIAPSRDGSARSSALASLEGTVFDSTSNGPLPAARVRLAGTRHAAAADSAGHFVLEDVVGGPHTLVVEHPRMESLGISALEHQVELQPGLREHVSLALPSPQTMLAAACTPEQRTRGWRAIVGIARDASSRVPLSGRTVAASWVLEEQGRRQRMEAVARTDARGHYKLCVPRGTEAYVTAGEASGVAAGQPLPRTDFVVHDLEVPGDPPGS